MAVEAGDTVAVAAGLAQGGEAALALGGVKEDWFMQACLFGHTGVLALLLELKDDREINVHVNDETAFRSACGYGHADVVQLLLSLTGAREINVHTCNGKAFRAA